MMRENNSFWFMGLFVKCLFIFVMLRNCFGRDLGDIRNCRYKFFEISLFGYS